MLRRSWVLPAVALAYFPLLGFYSVPLTGDQKVYLNIALEMREAGSWLKPLMFGQGSYYKPPLQYWATLVGWKVFGFNLWGALIPSLLACLLTCWLLDRIARLLQPAREEAPLAGLWFAGALGTISYATTAQMEIYVCLFYAAAWWAALKYDADALPKGGGHLWLYWAFAIAGLSALVKSPLYSVFWVLSFLSYLALTRNWRVFRSPHLYAAWVLGIGVASLWYAWILREDGARFWSDYAMRETWEKKGGNQSAAWELWGALLYFCIPFTLGAIAAARRVWIERRVSRVAAFALAWAWAPALFFTFYPYRIKPYLYILVPLAALLADRRWPRAIVAASGAVFSLLCGALAVVLYRSELTAAWVAAGFALLAVGVGVGALGRTRELALAALVGVFLFRAAAVDLGEQDLAGLREVAREQPRATFAMFDDTHNIWHEAGLISTALGRPIRRVFSLEEAVSVLKGGGTLVLSDGQKDRMNALTAILAGQGERRLIRERFWKRWKVRSGFPYRELALGGRAAVSDFEQRARREFALLSLGER